MQIRIRLAPDTRCQAMLTENCQGTRHAFRSRLSQFTQITDLAQLLILAPGNIMERQQVDSILFTRQPGDKPGGLPGAVPARNQPLRPVP